MVKQLKPIGFALSIALLGFLFRLWKWADFYEPEKIGQSLSIFFWNDIEVMWNQHADTIHEFPYINAYLAQDGTLHGAFEYPVLTGVYIWFTGLFAKSEYTFFIVTFISFIPLVLISTYLLSKMTKNVNIYWWALTPPLFWHLCINWDIIPVTLTLIAFYVLLKQKWGTVYKRGITAGIILAIGFNFKIFPALFIMPLVLYIYNTSEIKKLTKSFVTGIVSILTMISINLPFIAYNFEGWIAPFKFQFAREANISSNSLWYTIFYRGSANHEAYNSFITLVATPILFASLLIVTLIAFYRFNNTDNYTKTFYEISAAVLATFMILHKVNSPQYILWILPFFVLINIPTWSKVTYLIGDTILIISYAYFMIWGYENMSVQFIALGVILRSISLANIVYDNLFVRIDFNKMLNKNI